MPVVVLSRSLAEKLPRVTTTRGATSSSWRSSHGRHEAISSAWGVAVAGRATLHHVGDVNAPVAAHPQLLGHETVEELARAAHEGQTLTVLLGTGALADDHQVGVGVAGAEHDLGATLGQPAAGAARRLVGDLGEHDHDDGSYARRHADQHAPPLRGGFTEAADEVAALERAGLDVVWVPEAYAFDAPSMMGYLAARTERVTIASGIVPIFTRTPSLLAMTAAGIDALSGGRCMLGLGASGPQVIEGFHGVPYDATVARTREIIDICRQVWRRERVRHDGRHYQIPLPEGEGTGLGKPLKLITEPVRAEIPIAVAALGAPLGRADGRAQADAWLPAFFVPEGVRRHLGRGAADGSGGRGTRSRAPLEVFAGGPVAIGDDVEHQRDRARPQAALYIGGMGARGRTSTTTSSPRTATRPTPYASRTSTWRARRPRPRRPCRPTTSPSRRWWARRGS